MKKLNILKYLATFGVIVAFVLACEDDRPLPTLSSDVSTYTSPIMENPASKDPLELTPENATQTYEVYKWSRADYGVQLPVNYILEVDSSEAFSAPVELANTGTTSAEITVENFNDAVLALGLPAFSESSVKIRAKAIVAGGKVDTIFSNALTRTITTYQLSDCGDYCTIGLIGNATPGGWDNDTDMRLNDPTRVDKDTWTLIVYLTGGADVKFRANDSWDNNWGAADFPTGTGTQNGANITVPTSGYYKIVFNDKTGDYTFTALAGTEYATIGIIGTATAGGWDSDTDLTQDATDPHIWTGEFTLTDGEAKFRAENAWDVNWGSDTYPSGYATVNGPNVPVTAGTYFVWFNDVTGEYALMKPGDKDPYATIGVIGTATPGGWDTDTDLIQDPTNPYRWSKVITLSEGDIKFRADNDWTDDWGGSLLPKGVGIKGGSNLPVKAGQYVIYFHSGTGEYYFLK